MFGLGAGELFLILVIVLIVFGVGKLPELGSGLGEGIKNFKKGVRDGNSLDVTPPPGTITDDKAGHQSSSMQSTNAKTEVPK